MRYGFAIDHRKCIGCHACTTACKSENEVPLGVFRTWVKYIEKGEFPNTRRFFSVLRCNHCEDAPCVTICPTKALFKRDDGIVDFDPDLCIGCKSCMQACPYDALYIDPHKNTAAKCNYCAHRVDQGLLPACVVVCPEKAIIAGDIDDPMSEINHIISRENISVRKPEEGTKPKVYYVGADEASLTPEALTRRQAYLWGEVRGDERPREAVTADQQFTGPTDAETVYDVHHPKPWGWKVASYLWTKSIGAGAVLIAAILLLMGWSPASDTFTYAAPVIGMLFIVITSVLLIVDLKRPERFWYLMVKPNPRSWLVLGGWVLTGFGVIAFLWLAAAVVGLGGLQDVLMVVAIFAAIAAAGYTAFLFGQAKGRNYWQSPTVLPHLVAQSVTAGAAALIITGSVMDLSSADLRILTWILAAGVVTSVGLIATEFTMPHVNAHVRKTVHLITDGPYSMMLYGVVGVVGTILPLLFVLLALVTDQLTLFAWLASITALAGLLAYERIWVSAGQDVPLS
jgi:Fe-S-cluster-containing dehydrogenase component/formate-dependent nitrite reductase membrane component NrfD